MTKFLILRFSSIGDIVLTTPVVRCLKKQYKNAEVHFATKKSFKTILAHNPYLDKVHLLEDSLPNLLAELKKENFDYVIDLHNNLRTRIIKTALGKKSYSFKKMNVEKFLLTKFKLNKMPQLHIVDRYLATLDSFDIKNDRKGLDYFIPEGDRVDLKQYHFPNHYIGLVLGAKFATKRLPFEKLKELCEKINQPIVLLGGKEDAAVAEKLLSALPQKDLYNACGKFNLNQSASLVNQAQQIITHDTGLMHIAAALQKDIISIWGNTVSDFGMYPYVSKEKYTIIETKGLACRPCSKIGYDECPKGHFDCMNTILIENILQAIN